MGDRRHERRGFSLPQAPLIRVVGRILGAETEKHRNPDAIDHVWIRIHAGAEVIASINTSSKKNRLAGFDPRIRVGLVRGIWHELPPFGAEACAENDYADAESQANVYYEHAGREAMERLLLERCAAACLLEVWGAPYSRHGVFGVHQIHSRRASCAVPEEVRGRDGALKFYFREGQATELLLFKFCGQP